jgi:hypothetical protein
MHVLFLDVSLHCRLLLLLFSMSLVESKHLIEVLHGIITTLFSFLLEHSGKGTALGIFINRHSILVNLFLIPMGVIMMLVLVYVVMIMMTMVVRVLMRMVMIIIVSIIVSVVVVILHIPMHMLVSPVLFIPCGHWFLISMVMVFLSLVVVMFMSVIVMIMVVTMVIMFVMVMLMVVVVMMIMSKHRACE